MNNIICLKCGKIAYRFASVPLLRSILADFRRGSGFYGNLPCQFCGNDRDIEIE